MDLKKVVKTALIICLFAGIVSSEVLIIVHLSAWSQKTVLEKRILEAEYLSKKLEVLTKEKELKNEQLRQDLEAIRLRAFIKAYERSEYIIEVKK